MSLLNGGIILQFAEGKQGKLRKFQAALPVYRPQLQGNYRITVQCMPPAGCHGNQMCQFHAAV